MSEREPTQDELLAMAYVDGELSEEARLEFERRLSSEPSLTAEVSELKRLAVMARQCAPKEPMDFEWERIKAEPIHAASMSTGWALVAIAAIASILGLLIATAQSDLNLAFKLALFSAVGGFLLLLGMTVRARLRTLPHDLYREIQR